VSGAVAGVASPAARPEQRTSAPWVRALRTSLRLPQMRVGLVLTGLIVAIALLGPLVAPHSPTEFVGVPATGPAGDAVLGTDALGRDVLSRVLYGGRTVLWMSFASAALGVAFGVVVGLVAGYSRAWVDELLMRASDVVLAFPQIVLALLFVSMLGAKLWLIVLLVAISHAPRVARLVRSVTLEITRREFVEAAEILGVPRRRILAREVLPNLMTPLMVEFGLRLTWSIGIILGISFVGLGIQPPSADWGLMIGENRAALTTQPWGVLAPVACIAVFTIGTNLITEGIARAVAGIDRQSRAE
jgi:peptide/nickel transport system permease protein